MKKKQKRTNLFVRELTIKDAHSYSKISTGDNLHSFTPFFEAYTIEEARKRIENYITKYEKLYGLFTKANRLVAVFNVIDAVDSSRDATVHYFVGEQYYGNNYAAIGITLLSELLAGKYSHFYFEIDVDNTHSINVQKKIGSREGKTMNQYRSFVYAL